MPSSDGLEYQGLEKGKRKYLARLVRRDPRTGNKILDTRRVILANSKADALKQKDDLVEAELRKRQGRLRVGERLRFKAVSTEWFATVQSKGTRGSWGSHLNKLGRHFDDWWLDAMSTLELQRYLANLKGDKGQALDTNTVNSVRDVLIKVFEYAIEQGLVAENPAAATKRVRTRGTRRDQRDVSAKRPRKALTAAECQAYFAALRQHEPDVYPLVRVQFSLGCRFAEVSALRLDDVDMETGVVRIRRGQVRGAQGPTKAGYERLAALGPDTLALLHRHRKQMGEVRWPGHDELVFPRPPSTRRRHSAHWSMSTVHHAIRRALARVGLSEVKGSTHIARHTANNVGRLISETTTRMTIGHQTPEETLIYAMATPAEALPFAGALERALLGGSSGGSGKVDEQQKPGKTRSKRSPER